MSKTQRSLGVGDVIQSKEFQYGFLEPPSYGSRQFPGVIMAGVTNILDEERIDEDRRVSLAAKTGKVSPKVIRNKNYRNDPSRKTAQFIVVEKSEYSSSDEDGSCNADVVVIQRLSPNGRYDEKGELLWFYTNGSISASNYIELDQIKVVRKMKRIFV